MNIVTPIDSRQQTQVKLETLRFIQLAATIFHHSFKPVDIVFNLKGEVSGMFCSNGTQTMLRYNPYIFAKHYAYSLSNTVPHETAHYILHCLHGHNGVRPHGDEWKQLMLQFGVEPHRTNRLDLAGIPVRRQLRHAYSCSCTSHQISTIRHNRIKNGEARYFCRTCNGELVTAN